MHILARLLIRQPYSRHCVGLRFGGAVLAIAFLLCPLPAFAKTWQTYPSSSSLQGLPSAQEQPCAYVMCLEGLSQPIPNIVKGGPVCHQLLCTYFSRRVFDSEGFDAPSTHGVRYAQYLAACSAISPALTQTVDTTYGYRYTAADCP